MNILHVVASIDPAHGGLSQGIRNTLPQLEKLGVYNEVVSLDSKEASYLGKDSFKTHALNGKGPWRYSKNFTPWLMDNLERFNAVIIHGLWLYPSYATSRAILKYTTNAAENSQGSRTNIRLFVMPHGMLDPYFQHASGRRLKALRNWVYWKIFEHRVVNEATAMLFTCETELLLARKPFRPYRPKHEISVGFGIEPPPPFSKELENAFQQKCPQIKNGPYLLFLSRIHPKKGVELLIQAYLAILKSRKEFLPKLIIVGPGLDSRYGKDLETFVNSTPELAENVFFTGMLTGDAKWGAFYGCEAFVLPSHQENFGIAVVEALACNKPVLISDQVNIWNEIANDGAGIVCPDTIEGTIALLERWLKLSEEEKRRMSELSKVCFEKNFKIDMVAQRLLRAVS